MSGTPGVSFSSISAASAVAPTDQVLIFQPDPQNAALTVPARSTVQTQGVPNTVGVTAVSGQTVQIPAGAARVLISAAGPLAALTVQMPGTPLPGLVVKVKFGVAVTALGWLAPGQSFLVPPPGSASAGLVAGFQFSGTVWWPE